MGKKITLLCLGLVWAILMSTTSTTRAAECSYATAGGKEFVFRAQTQSNDRGYVYRDFRVEPKLLSPHVAYSLVAGKQGKVLDSKVDADNTAWYPVLMSDCRKLYVRAGLGDRFKPEPGQRLTVGQLEYAGAIYFERTLQQANALVGRTIWIDANGGNWQDLRQGVWKAGLIDERTGRHHPMDHLGTARVLGIHTAGVPGSRDGEPFYLRAKLESGHVVLVPYRTDFMHTSNPIKPDWPEDLVRKIRARSVIPSMNREQVAVAWGRTPNVKTETIQGKTHETWKYGDRGYQQAYFVNGVLTGLHRVPEQTTAGR